MHQPLQLVGEHRARTRREALPEVFEQARVFEYAAEHIRQSHSHGKAEDEGQCAAPAAFVPHEGENQYVERNPHCSTRYGFHRGVHRLAAVEIEPKKQRVVESVHFLVVSD